MLAPANALLVFDLDTGRRVRTLAGYPCGVNALAVSADGRLVASAPNPGLYMYQDPCPRLWNVDTGEHLRVFDGHVHAVTAVAVSPDGRHVVSGGGNCFRRYRSEFTVRLWDAETGELRVAVDARTGPVAARFVGPRPHRDRGSVSGYGCSGLR